MDLHWDFEQRKRGQGTWQLWAGRIMYLAVLQRLRHGFRHKQDFSSVTSDHKQEAVGSLKNKKSLLDWGRKSSNEKI